MDTAFCDSLPFADAPTPSPFTEDTSACAPGELLKAPSPMDTEESPSSFATLEGEEPPSFPADSAEDVTVAEEAGLLCFPAVEVEAAPSEDCEDDDVTVCEGLDELEPGRASLLSLCSEPESLSRSSMLTPPTLPLKKGIIMIIKRKMSHSPFYLQTEFKTKQFKLIQIRKQMKKTL